ncbi:hypothetical protein [Sporolactobacillus putidus]|uniref:Uncharacterized protein n=1 Tax=Sporolactobacillus putidus TaxID=492735 RepID=A0A917W5V8_9BACL|nr:hypothetical protein [Sporolactobacillus putidus]GGL65709.1 hypothetical protein GCM10007968_32150 [Sporolactobacillus putidus]
MDTEEFIQELRRQFGIWGVETGSLTDEQIVEFHRDGVIRKEVSRHGPDV